MVSAGIIDAAEQSDVLAGRHRFTVDEYLAMEVAGILHEDDRVELMDGVIIIMPPIGLRHVGGTDWMTTLLVPPLVGRATVRVGGPIYLNDRQRAPARFRPGAVEPPRLRRDGTDDAGRGVPGYRICRQFTGV